MLPRKAELPIPLSALFSNQKEVLPSIHEVEAQTTQVAEKGSGSSRHGSPLPGTNFAISQTGTHEREVLLLIKESDKLSIEHFGALKRKDELEKQ